MEEPENNVVMERLGYAFATLIFGSFFYVLYSLFGGWTNAGPPPRTIAKYPYEMVFKEDGWRVGTHRTMRGCEDTAMRTDLWDTVTCKYRFK